MNASDAKKLATTHKTRTEEDRKLKQEEAIDKDVELLLGFFRDKIEDAVKKGHLSIPKEQFPIDRFADDVLREVATILRKEGYSFHMDKHNAFHMVAFNIGWA